MTALAKQALHQPVPLISCQCTKTTTTTTSTVAISSVLLSWNLFNDALRTRLPDLSPLLPTLAGKGIQVFRKWYVSRLRRRIITYLCEQLVKYKHDGKKFDYRLTRLKTRGERQPSFAFPVLWSAVGFCPYLGNTTFVLLSGPSEKGIQRRTGRSTVAARLPILLPGNRNMAFLAARIMSHCNFDWLRDYSVDGKRSPVLPTQPQIHHPTTMIG